MPSTPTSPLPPFSQPQAFRALPMVSPVDHHFRSGFISPAYTGPVIHCPIEPLPSVVRPSDQHRIGSCAVLLIAGLRISALEQPPTGFLPKPVAILLPQALPPLSVLIRRPSPLLPYAPDSLLPPSPPSSRPGPSEPFQWHSLSTTLPFRFPVHRLHWSHHSLSPPCPFRPSSIIQTSVGPGLLIPSEFYTPHALN